MGSENRSLRWSFPYSLLGRKMISMRGSETIHLIWSLACLYVFENVTAEALGARYMG